MSRQGDTQTEDRQIHDQQLNRHGNDNGLTCQGETQTAKKTDRYIINSLTGMVMIMV